MLEQLTEEAPQYDDDDDEDEDEVEDGIMETEQLNDGQIVR